MNIELTFSEAELAHLRLAAEQNQRTLPDQLEYWLRLGRTLDDDPAQMPSRVSLALNGLLSPIELNAAEQDEYLDQLGESLWKASAFEDAYFAEMRARGMSTGD